MRHPNNSRLLSVFLTHLFAIGALSCSSLAERKPASFENNRSLINASLESGELAGVALVYPSEEAGYETKCQTEKFIREYGCARVPGVSCEKPNTFSYYADSCWDPKTIGLMDWSPSHLVITPEHFSNISVNDLASGLVYRHYRNVESPRITSDAFQTPAYSFYSGMNAEIVFRDHILEKIVKNGFWNQHRSKTSEGFLADDARWSAEETTMKIELPREDIRAADLAPKYLFGVPTDGSFVRESGFTYAFVYGNVLAVLRPDMKNRMTITLQDSLALFSGGGRMNSLKWIQNKTENITETYSEIQIWGTLDLGNIEHLIVNCPGADQISPKRIAEIYRLTHLPIYSCKIKQTTPNQSVEVPSQRAFPGKLLHGKKGDRFIPPKAPATPAPAKS